MRQISRFISERYRPYLSAVAVIAVFAIMIAAMYRLTAEVRYEDVVAALRNTSPRALVLAALFTSLSYCALVFYDFNALDYIGRKLPPWTVASTAFIAYAVGNSAGFGPLSGGAIRYRSYTRLGLQPSEIARVIAFVTLAFGLGLLGVSAISLMIVAPRLGSVAGIGSGAVRAVALSISALLGGLLFFSRNGREITVGKIVLHLPDTATSSRQFLITAFDLAASASALFVLLPEMNIGWPTFFAIYAAAIGLGVLSHVPAGLGVFETVILAGLGSSVDPDQLLGSLVLYRVIYYVLPLLIALIAATAGELRLFAHRKAVEQTTKVASRLAPNLLSAYALLLGALLVFSSVTPTSGSDLAVLADLLPLPIVEGAHFLSSILGLVLVICSRGLAQRLDGAWWVALGTSSIALLLSVAKALAVFEAAGLAVFLIALVISARTFTRRASLLGQVLGPNWLAAVAVVLIGAVGILFFVYRDTQYSHGLWWQFEFFEEAPRSLRALVGVAVASAAVGMFSLLRPAVHHPTDSTEEDLPRALAIVKHQDNADANLVRMGDKKIMFSSSGRSFIMYGIQGRSRIALADPVGHAEEFSDLVWRFIDEARAAGCRAVFYQVTPALLPFCIDAGFRPFKIGETAMVNLTTFHLSGGSKAMLRQALSRGEREGLTFSIVDPPDLQAILPDLKKVSDAWLDHNQTSEKTFSLGCFDPDYVTSQPVALLKKADDIVAFATLMTTETKVEATVDLMRYSPAAPRGSMDFLFVSLMKTMQQQGYQRFSLGMAPLSGMSNRETAPVWDRIGSLIFEHAERFYNFKGLRAFKAKYHPRWEPRYLAVSSGTGVAVALMDIALLVSGGMRGLISK